MTRRIAGAPLDFAALRTELEVPGDFAFAVTDDATRAAEQVRLPDRDATDIPFVTIDPPGSRDLARPLHTPRAGEGFVVSSATAAVASFAAPGGALAQEAPGRGETLYSRDGRAPLPPPQLSEGAA